MMPALRRNPTAVFAAAARSFGDVAYLKIGPRRGYLVTHPDDIRHVLQDNARNYHKSPLYDKLRVSLGNGLLTSEEVTGCNSSAWRSRPFIGSASKAGVRHGQPRRNGTDAAAVSRSTSRTK